MESDGGFESKAGARRNGVGNAEHLERENGEEREPKRGIQCVKGNSVCGCEGEFSAGCGTMSAALKLALEGELGRGKDDVIVSWSIFPSSLESILATLMLGRTVVEG